MDQTKIESKLKKKIQLNGRRLDEVLAPEELALIAFWSYLGNRGTDIKAKRDKNKDQEDPPDPYKDLTDDDIDQELEIQGQRILDQFNGDARAALNSLL